MKSDCTGSQMLSCHRVGSVFGAVRNHSKYIKQIQSLTPPPAVPCPPPSSSAFTSFYFLRLYACKNQEGSGGFVYDGVECQVVSQQCLRLENSPRPDC